MHHPDSTTDRSDDSGGSESIDDSDEGDDPSLATRRQYARWVGGLGALPLANCLGFERPFERPNSASPSRPRSDPPDERDDFVWLTGGQWRDERLRSNLFAFAGRHDLAVVIPLRAASFDSVADRFRRALRDAATAGLDVWLRIGLLTDLTAEAFVRDREAREAHLDRLRRVCRVYDDLADGGRVVLWEEAPVIGQWVDGGAWNAAAVDNMLAHGPQIFDAQRRAVRDAAGDREVGIFVHFPYVVDSKSPDVFATLTDRLAERGARPDFAFLDFYRGWYEKDVGPDAADDTVRSLVDNARTALDGAPVFYMGQAHTINPNHTPSKEAIRSNVRASLDADAAGLGWYARTRYVPTEQGFDPYVPNASGAEFDGPVGTDTVARDRYLYAWLSTLATRRDFDPGERFDCWLWSEDVSFHDHRLLARADDGWIFLCAPDGYADGDYPYGGGPNGTVSAVRGLRRDRFLSDGVLNLRIRTDGGDDGAGADDGTGAALRAALAMPCDPDAYVAEHEAAALLAGDAPAESFALGSARDRVSLVPGTTRRVDVPIRTTDSRSLHGLQHPDFADAVDRLRDVDRRSDAAPDGRFDLWLRGRGLSDPGTAPSLRDRTGTPRSPADASVVAVSTDDVAVYYGLARDRFLADGLSLADDRADETTVETAYAMPYAGSAAFRPPARAATLLAEQPEEVETFSLARVDRR